MSARKKGFTLVELLVVITIIAILATIGLIAYSSAQKSARIAKRIQDLKAIQTALETYYSLNKKYPTTGGAGTGRSECSIWGSYPSDNVIEGLVPIYIVAFPADPQMNTGTNKNCYVYSSNGIDYKLFDVDVTEITLSDLEAQPILWDPRHPDYLPVTSRCVSPERARRFAIYSLDARCW